MSSIQISLKLAPSKYSEGYNRVNVLTGGIRIVIGNTVVTKYMDDSDHEYRGGFIYSILIGCIGRIPDLFAGKNTKSILLMELDYLFSLRKVM